MRVEETVTVTGQQLLDIYLDGFVSGVSSALHTFSPLADNQIIHIALRLGAAMTQTEDDTAMVLNEIQERLSGTDSGPKHSVIPVDMGRIPLGPGSN
jgi:hypothetical protein